jgi:hypothetical protein
MTPHEQTTEAAVKTVDAASVLILGATIIDKLPAIAALFTLIWTSMRILNILRSWMGLPTVGWLGKPNDRDDADSQRD